MPIELSRRKLLELSLVSPAAAALAACGGKSGSMEWPKPEREPLSDKHLEFFSNGSVLSTETRLVITADPAGLNALVTEPQGGLHLPEDFVIVTLITPLLPQSSEQAFFNSIPKTVEPAVYAQFPKQLTNRKYSVNFLFSQDAVNNARKALIPPRQTKDKVSVELDPITVANAISNQLSIGWFIGVRNKYVQDYGLPTPSNQLPGKILELIAKNPPIKVVKIKEGAQFGN